MKIKSHVGFSEKGQRANNEDYILSNIGSDSGDRTITIVCDGVGGAQKGEIASRLVCYELMDYLEKQESINEEILKNGVSAVELKLNAYVASHPYSDGMATTLTIAIIDKENVHVMHVGDSKILCIQNKLVTYTSYDHSLVNEMVETGLISEEEALTHPKRNVITRALAASGNSAEPTLKTIAGWQKDDAIFLCSDGVLESYSVEGLAQLITSEKTDREIVEEIKATCSTKSKDNYSGYLIRF